MSDQPSSRAEQVRRLYEEAETRSGTAVEGLVSSEGFGEILSMVTGNAMALTQVANRGLDQLVRGLRVAGRSDVTRLGRQLARTEDKLEQVLQVVEQLEQRLADSQRATGDGGEESPTRNNGAATPRGTGTSVTRGSK